MKKTIILSFLLSAFAAFAQQHDAEYRLIREHFTINEDGTSDYNYRKELTLYTNRAMTAYATNGETFIVYNPTCEFLTINESYTIRPDGTRVETPKNAFIEQLPSECADCARYSGIRELVVVHTGLELGATIVLDYTIHRHNSDIIGNNILAEEYPIDRYEIKLSCAEKYKYLVQPINLDRIQYTTSGNKGEFNLTAFNLPARLKDSYLPASDELYPQINITDLTEEELLMFYNGTTDDKYIEYGSKIKDYEPLLNSLKANTPEATVTNIRNWVADNITTIHLPYIADDYAVNETLTWEENCGLNSSKATLLAALLQKAGFKTRIQWGYTKMPIVNNMQFVMPKPGLTRLIVTIDGAQYLLNPKSNTPLETPHLDQTTDENTVINVTRALDYSPKPIANGYSKIELPRHDNALRLDLSQLTSIRINPLKCNPTSEQYHYTIQLPSGVKMVSKPRNIETTYPGIGSIKVSIQAKNNTITIDRRLVIENGSISAANYIKFRHLISVWETTNEIIVK